MCISGVRAWEVAQTPGLMGGAPAGLEHWPLFMDSALAGELTIEYQDRRKSHG
jgi:hypothetical protein